MPGINNVDRNSLVSSANENNGSAQNRIQNAQNSTVLSGQQSTIDSDALTLRNAENARFKPLFNKNSRKAEHFARKAKSDRERLDNAKEKTLPREGEAMSTPKSEARIDLEERQEKLDVLIKQEGVSPIKELSFEEELNAQLEEADEAILDENGEINDENTSNEDTLGEIEKSLSGGR